MRTLLIGMPGREEAAAQFQHVLLECTARYAVPHEAFSGSEPHERCREFTGWLAVLFAPVLLVTAFAVAGASRVGLLAGGMVLVAVAIFALRW